LVIQAIRAWLSDFMTASRYDFTILQGSDIDLTIQVWADANKTVIQNLNGWDARMMIRSTRDSTGSPLVSLTTTPAVGLTINGPAGQVIIYVNGATTAGYTWSNGQYDLEVYNTSTGAVKRVLMGNVSVSTEVTR